MWSDAAREAALEARRRKAKENSRHKRVKFFQVEHSSSPQSRLEMATLMRQARSSVRAGKNLFAKSQLAGLKHSVKMAKTRYR